MSFVHLTFLTFLMFLVLVSDGHLANPLAPWGCSKESVYLPAHNQTSWRISESFLLLPQTHHRSQTKMPSEITSPPPFLFCRPSANQRMVRKTRRRGEGEMLWLLPYDSTP